jgi:toxin ParE1/3/4
MRSIRWSKDALRDLEKIDDWYANRDPNYADRVGRAAVSAAKFLTEFPFAGPSYSGKVRKWPVPKTDYRLLYRVENDSIEIIRVRHVREEFEKVL